MSGTAKSVLLEIAAMLDEAEHDDTGLHRWPVVLRRAGEKLDRLLEDEAARDALMELLRTERGLVAEWAARGLGRLGPDPEVEQLLHDIARSRRGARVGAARALVAIAPARAVELAARCGPRTAVGRAIPGLPPRPTRRRTNPARASKAPPSTAARTESASSAGSSTWVADRWADRALEGIAPRDLRRWVQGLRRFRLVRATPLMAANDADRFSLSVPARALAELGLPTGHGHLFEVPVYVSAAGDRAWIEVSGAAGPFTLTEADYRSATHIEALLPDELHSHLDYVSPIEFETNAIA